MKAILIFCMISITHQSQSYGSRPQKPIASPPDWGSIYHEGQGRPESETGQGGQGGLGEPEDEAGFESSVEYEPDYQGRPGGQGWSEGSGRPEDQIGQGGQYGSANQGRPGKGPRPSSHGDEDDSDELLGGIASLNPGGQYGQGNYGRPGGQGRPNNQAKPGNQVRPGGQGKPSGQQGQGNQGRPGGGYGPGSQGRPGNNYGQNNQGRPGGSTKPGGQGRPNDFIGPLDGHGQSDESIDEELDNWSQTEGQSEGRPDGRPEGRPDGRPEGRPESWQEGRPEGKPESEPLCKALMPPNPKTVELSPFVLAKVDYHSVYPCDKDSRFKKIIYQKEVESRVTCNGILYSPGVDYYDAIPNVKDGRPVKERLNLTDYSSIYSWNNGNANYQECGTILGGRCHGDTLYGWGIYQAEDKEGCVKQGNPGNVGIIRRLDIIGKCASKCNLGISIQAYSPHISNRGQNYGFSAPIQTEAEPNSDNQNKMETAMKIEPKES